jgi:ribose transport system substrate-binding protein
VQCKHAAFIAIACLGIGCNRQHSRRIAVIPKGTEDVFFQSVHAGAIAAGLEFKAEILWDGPPQETEYGRQLAIMDSMLNRHVDGIALAAANRNSLNAALDRAARENIPVVIFDSGVDSTNYVSFVATNNYEGGRMGGRKLGQLLNGKGSVAMIDHAPGSASTMDRERGFKDVMATEFPAIAIVAEQYSMSDRAKGMGVTENILTAHPELNGVFASSEPSSVGAAQALKARGLAGKLRLVAFDSSEGLVDDLKAGVIDALIAQDPFKIGYEAVRAVSAKLDGNTPLKTLDLSAVVITKVDLDKTEVQQLLHPDLKKYLGQ